MEPNNNNENEIVKLLKEIKKSLLIVIFLIGFIAGVTLIRGIF